MTSNWELRNEFQRLLSVDSFDFTGPVTSNMVMDQFDLAIRNLDRRDKERHAQDMADIQLDEEQREQANANE